MNDIIYFYLALTSGLMGAVTFAHRWSNGELIIPSDTTKAIIFALTSIVIAGFSGALIGYFASLILPAKYAMLAYAVSGVAGSIGVEIHFTLTKALHKRVKDETK